MEDFLIDGIQQEQSEWCWAACAQMLLRASGEARRQCDIVAEATGVPGCCADPPPAKANRQLRVAPDFVSLVHHLHFPAQLVDRALSADEVRSQLAQGPIAVCLETAASGHYVLVIGMRETGDPRDPMLLVNDPATGETARPVGYRLFVAGLGLAAFRGEWEQTVNIFA